MSTADNQLPSEDENATPTPTPIPIPDAAPESEARRAAELKDRFWNAENNCIDTEALIRSYNELEARLGAPGNTVPARADAYDIRIDHPAIDIDADVNEILHASGFSNKQAQVVYDLARDKLLPLIEELSQEATQNTHAARLENHFGGTDRWQAVSRQIATWGQSKLPQDVFQSLSTSFDGVIALHRMMTSDEPVLIGGSTASATTLSEDGLRELMRNPKYWRDQDPATVKQVQQGFEALYPG